MRSLANVFARRPMRVILSLAIATLGLGATKGPDAGGYIASDSIVYSLVDISGASGGARVLSGTDDGAVALTIPFPFRFYGVAYTIVCASSNGALYFVTAAPACNGFSDFANVDLSTATTPNDLPAALPMWSDLSFQEAGAGSVYYQTIGAPGSRRFVVQWQNAYPQDSPNPVTFQVLLFEGTHKMRFQYRTVDLGAGNPATNGGLATVGIRNSQALSSQKLIEWSYNAKVIADSSALEFSAPVTLVKGDVDGDGVVNCTDLAIVKASYGKRTGQAGYDARADVNGDGIINLTDLTIVSSAISAGTRCP
jgi:Dockerin type I domain